jgi:hypothetical protein
MIFCGWILKMRIANRLATLTLIVAAALAPMPSDAQRKVDRCQGRLHQDNTGLWIGGGQGEDESICEIGKSERAKVLAVCKPEQPCRISGHAMNCKDSGECSEFTSIISVQKR